MTGPMTSSLGQLKAKREVRFYDSPGWMVVIGLLARVLYILIAQTYRFSVAHWSTWEMANLAYSLAIGHGFSSPFGGYTGPSAWTAPLYPWLISLAFRAFGIFSPAAALTMLLFNSVFAALTSWTVFRIARRVLNPTVAVWSGWIWALLPYSIYWSVTWVWETSLSAFLLSLLFMLSLEMEDDNRLSSWFTYGLLWGVAGLTNTSLIAWLPFSGCWLAYQLHRRGKRFLVPVVLGAVVFWATLTPWLVRNYSEFSKLVFIRGDLGVELRSGNNPQADGGWIKAYHPGNNGVLYAQYEQMGEAAFDAEQARLAKEWIAQNPKMFLQLCFHRFLFFWAGLPRKGLEQVKNLLFLISSLLAIGGLLLALKRRVHGRFLFASLLLSYPLVYYLTFPTPRYRHAIDPELTLLAVFLISQSLLMRRQDAASATHDASVPLPETRVLVLRFLRWIAAAAVVFILLIAFALVNNNFSLVHRSRSAFDKQLDTELDKSIAWIAAHPEVSGTNPPLMYMVADIEKMTGDPRLPAVLAANVGTLNTRYATYRLTPFWMRFVNPQAPLPFITEYELRSQPLDQRWFSYAISPNQVYLSQEDLGNLFSLTKYSWGARHHQVLGLIMYRDFNGDSPKVDDTLRQLCLKEARDQTYDFRVTDAYVQRNAFMIAAGQSDLVRSRWIERILDNQTADGSWNYCWYGWCRGVAEFGTVYPGHTTIQAAWGLALLKYRHPEWIQEHYH
jgi:4-amino-4-deoxy-L-arabinose transferase-like glycosyltransferase